jgi:hypothetical protein
MARDRNLLQQLLDDLMTEAGMTPRVYFQPPPNYGMQYPAIVYNRDTTNTEFAGNLPYKLDLRYQVTVMDRDPDSKLPDLLKTLPQCTHDRWFAADGLNHDVFTIYF